jgi:hypothetical protein
MLGTHRNARRGGPVSFSQPMRASLWEELRPGYAYLWHRLTAHGHADPDDRTETFLLAFFLVTFVPWLPLIWGAHWVRVLLRMLMR